MARGYAVETLHGDLSQAQRDRVMRRFRAGQADVLIATDVAARGLDIPDVTPRHQLRHPGERRGLRPPHRPHRPRRPSRRGDHPGHAARGALAAPDRADHQGADRAAPPADRSPTSPSAAATLLKQQIRRRARSAGRGYQAYLDVDRRPGRRARRRRDRGRDPQALRRRDRPRRPRRSSRRTTSRPSPRPRRRHAGRRGEARHGPPLHQRRPQPGRRARRTSSAPSPTRPASRAARSARSTSSTPTPSSMSRPSSPTASSTPCAAPAASRAARSTPRSPSPVRAARAATTAAATAASAAAAVPRPGPRRPAVSRRPRRLRRPPHSTATSRATRRLPPRLRPRRARPRQFERAARRAATSTAPAPPSFDRDNEPNGNVRPDPPSFTRDRDRAADQLRQPPRRRPSPLRPRQPRPRRAPRLLITPESRARKTQGGPSGPPFYVRLVRPQRLVVAERLELTAAPPIIVAIVVVVVLAPTSIVFVAPAVVVVIAEGAGEAGAETAAGVGSRDACRGRRRRRFRRASGNPSFGWSAGGQQKTRGRSAKRISQGLTGREGFSRLRPAHSRGMTTGDRPISRGVGYSPCWHQHSTPVGVVNPLRYLCNLSREATRGGVRILCRRRGNRGEPGPTRTNAASARAYPRPLRRGGGAHRRADRPDRDRRSEEPGGGPRAGRGALARVAPLPRPTSAIRWTGIRSSTSAAPPAKGRPRRRSPPSSSAAGYASACTPRPISRSRPRSCRSTGG